MRKMQGCGNSDRFSLWTVNTPINHVKDSKFEDAFCKYKYGNHVRKTPNLS